METLVTIFPETDTTILYNCYAASSYNLQTTLDILLRDIQIVNDSNLAHAMVKTAHESQDSMYSTANFQRTRKRCKDFVLPSDESISTQSTYNRRRLSIRSIFQKSLNSSRLTDASVADECCGVKKKYCLQDITSSLLSDCTEHSE